MKKRKIKVQLSFLLIFSMMLINLSQAFANTEIIVEENEGTFSLQQQHQTISGGGYHSLQVRSDGTVWICGQNNDGQLGDGTYYSKSLAVQVQQLSDVVAVSAGYYHNLALKSDGTVWAWGSNASGELGDNTTKRKSKPVMVTNLTDVVAISAGDYYSLALKSDGTVWAWGNNEYGQLGDGTTDQRTIPVMVQELSDVIAIAATSGYSLALKSDGTVWTWGRVLSNGVEKVEYTVNPIQVQGLSDIIAISAAANHALAIKSDGTVWCWGKDYYKGFSVRYVPVQVLELDNAVSASAGYNYSLVLKSDGTVWAWGENNYGQLGIGDKSIKINYEPLQVKNLKNVLSVEAALYHSLAQTSDGSIWAWGINNAGQIGNGTTINIYSPVLSKEAVTPTKPENLSATVNGNSIVLNWNASSGTTDISYEIYRDDVLIGNTSSTSYTDIDAPVDKIIIYKVIAFDELNKYSEPETVVVNDNEAPSTPKNLIVFCDNTIVSLQWNASIDNVQVEGYAIYRNGEKIGDSKTNSFTDYAPKNSTFTYVVKAYDKSANFSEASNEVTATTGVPLYASDTYSLQVQDDGTVWAWGYNSSGQLGDGTRNTKYVPVKVKGLDNVVAVAGGNSHSLALKNDGTVWAWGSNLYGQLGDGSTTSRYEPAIVPELNDIIAIEAEDYYCLALKSDGTVWAWGRNTSGQLGDGTTTDRHKPVMVKGLNDIVAISAGGCSLALKKDGTVYMWGYMSGFDKTATPVQVKGLSDLKDISSGQYHNLAIKNDGTVWAWGSNSYGQLGDGTRDFSYSVPVQVKNLDNVVDIKASYYYSLALRSDGTVWAWGLNDYGQLGDGTTTSQSIPVQVLNLSNATYISAGQNHSLAIKNDGTVWAWGNNQHGKLGDGTEINRYVPILPKDVTPPTMPQNLSAQIKENLVILSWGASTDGVGVAGYEIYRDDVKIGETADTVYKDNISISTDKIYVYKVKAYDVYGNISDAEAVVLNDTEAPTRPSGLKVVSSTTTTVTLKWEASKDNLWVDGYEIYRNGEKVGITKQNSFIDNVPFNSTYKYQVIAFDKSGNLSNASDSVTVTVKGEIKPVRISAGNAYSIAVKTDGTLWKASTLYRLSEEIKDVVAVATGYNHNLALKKDGTVWGWGFNSNGEMGDGTYVTKTVNVYTQDGSESRWAPVKTGFSDIVAIDGGCNFSIALKSDGTVWTSGYNYYGQLGDGTFSNRCEPTKVQGLTNVVAISAGEYHCLALKKDGTVWAWGHNLYGQLGDGPNALYSAIPVQLTGLLMSWLYLQDKIIVLH